MKSRVLPFRWRVPVSPLVCFGLAWLLAQTETVRRIEWRTLDWRTNFRVAFQAPPDPRISVILYEDNTDANLRPWPPDRAVHGEMIGLLAAAKPAVVTWDVIVDAVREGDGDAAMGAAAQAAADAGVSVITASVSNPTPTEEPRGLAGGPTRPLAHVEGDTSQLMGDRFAVRPFPQLRAASLYGFADTPPGPDGIRRQIPLVVRIGREVFPSLALQTLLAYYRVAPEAVRVRLGEAIYLPTRQRGEIRVPIDAGGRFLLNYRYDFQEDVADFRTYAYIDVMLRLNARYVEGKPEPVPEHLAGGIVFIGQTVTGKADAGPTPRSAQAPLVLVHANVVNNVLAGDFAREAPPWLVWLGAVGVGYGAWVLGMKRPVGVSATLGLLAVVVYGACALAAWIGASLWLPLTGPLAGFVGLEFIVAGRRVLSEQRAREQVKQMFGTYLSPELLQRMLKDGRNVAAVSSERRPVTVLFSDLRDFTSLAESLRDDALVRQLNEYLEAMVECIHREGGTLHKFIGDAVMAVWGDLATDGVKVDAAKAVRAALAMHRSLADLNVRWAAAGMPTLRMGIGINHGVVLIGNIGSSRRMEFTAIGDAVNLASRLESLNKELKTRTLVGESVKDLLSESFAFRGCGSVPVKGKAKPVEVFELLGEATHVESSLPAS